jgi:hypothetical protein
MRDEAMRPRPLCMSARRHATPNELYVAKQYVSTLFRPHAACAFVSASRTARNFLSTHLGKRQKIALHQGQLLNGLGTALAAVFELEGIVHHLFGKSPQRPGGFPITASPMISSLCSCQNNPTSPGDFPGIPITRNGPMRSPTSKLSSFSAPWLRA